VPENLELQFYKEPLQTSVPVEIPTFDHKLARKQDVVRKAQALWDQDPN
jgi:hypothetical protein